MSRKVVVGFMEKYAEKEKDYLRWYTDDTRESV
jgi:hypothetical protein